MRILSVCFRRLRGRGQRAASQSDALLLLHPGIGQSLGEAADREVRTDPQPDEESLQTDVIPFVVTEIKTVSHSVEIPPLTTRGVGGDRKEDGVLPRRALVAHAIAPSANAIADWQRIKAEAAVGVADEGNKAPHPPSQTAMRAEPVEPAAMPDAADITAVKGAANVPMKDSPFGRRMRLRGRGRCTCEGRDDCENPCFP